MTRLAYTRRVRVDELDTPVLSADLDAVERNIAGMQRYCDEHGFALRPHIKTHKVVELARLQVDAGACGITCQKLGEAEVMADAGFDDILISFPLVGAAKVERLAALAARIRVGVVGDSPAVATGLQGIEVDFLVECDTGGRRTGVQSPDEAAELAALVAQLDGPRFAGLMTYPTKPESGPWLDAAREAIERKGLAVGVPPRGMHSSSRRSPSCGPERTSTETAPASPTAPCRSTTARCASPSPSSAGRRGSGRASTPAPARAHPTARWA